MLRKLTPDKKVNISMRSGVSFDEAWATREQGEIDGLATPFISKEMLKRNKAASGRLQDLADLEYL